MLSYHDCSFNVLVSLGRSIIEDNPESLVITVPDNDKSSSREDVNYGDTKGENERQKVFLCINMPIILYMDS